MQRPPDTPPPSSETWLRLIAVVFLLLVFLSGIRGLGEGFEGLGEDVLDSIFAATDNPFVGLTVGILTTTLMQSSSVTTSMIVALVAAPDNPLPIENAVPMIMGANIGTTVTNTIVSLGHIGRADEFRRAFAVATCHDFFNFLTVAVLLPLELATGLLTRLSGAAAHAVVGIGAGGKLPNPVKAATKAIADPTIDLLQSLSDSHRVGAILVIAVSAAVIFGTLGLIVRTLRHLAATRMQVYMTRSLDSNAYVGILVGIIVTVMVQSSSITTSVMVPLAGAGVLTLGQAFPVTLGANIGTTVTALLASMAAPPETAHLAVQIAGVHLLFNLIGTVGVYPIEAVRRVPLRMAERMAEIAAKSKTTALVYVVGIFYGLPAALIFISRLF